MARALPNDLGDPLLNAWILAWDADGIRNGFQGFWDAPIFYPYLNTLTYSEHLLGIAVLTAPVQWVSGNPMLAYNVAFLLSYVVAGCGMYLLAASLTGSRAAGVIAGVCFAFVPYRVTQVSHLQVLTYGWMPLGLWALHRFFARGSRMALLGFAAFFLLQGLSNLYFLYFFTLPVVIVVVVELVRARQPRARSVASLSVAAVLILLVLTPTALAYRETQADLGFVRSRGALLRYSADLASYLHVSPSLAMWGERLPVGRPELGLFPGFTLLGLAAVGLFVGVTRGTAEAGEGRMPAREIAGVYGVVGLMAVALSLGPEPTAFGHRLAASGPYDWLATMIPGLGGVRVPARMAVVAYLALAVLAAVGAAFLVRGRTRWPSLLFSTLLVIAPVAEGYAGPLPMARFEPAADRDTAAAYEWLRVAPPGAVLELPTGRTAGQRALYNARYQFARMCCNLQEATRARLVESPRLRLMPPLRTAC